jgi:hypothetical protein
MGNDWTSEIYLAWDMQITTLATIQSDKHETLGLDGATTSGSAPCNGSSTTDVSDM